MNDREDTRDPVEELAEEFIRQHRRGERPSVEDYVQAHPAWSARIRELFPALLLLEGLRSDSRLAPEGHGDGAAPHERFGDFRVVREIGRGGMGVVYEAVQESLGRRVALKVLPGSYSSSARALERFRREAQAAARLHHTNIVSVFGVGEHGGRHFYVMQCIEGRSLDCVLAELAGQRDEGSQPSSAAQCGTAADPTEDFVGADVARAVVRGGFELGSSRGGGSRDEAPSWSAAASLPDGRSAGSAPAAVPRQVAGGRLFSAAYWRSVAGIGVQLAAALHYAHKQGTLHRDVKPGNVILDGQGTAWITDFGLAKVLDQDDLTHPGDVVGTLRYMAPEQLDGEHDARSDVYSLGLTLYELLTLRPAFTETSRRKLLRQVSQQDAPRPRSLNPSIPRDLETIVLKAMAREPEGRYQTAGELTEDLERFLTDRPILARRASPVEHAWRWCRRNPALAASSAAALVLLVALAAGASFGYVRRTQALARESLLREEAQQQRRRAEANLRLAAEAFDEVFSKLTGAPEARMLGGPEESLWYGGAGPAAVSPKDMALLESLLEFYDRFARENRDDQRWQHETALAFRRVADIQMLLGGFEEATAACRRAIGLFARLCEASPDRPEYLIGQAGAHNALGGILGKAGRVDEAFQESRRALELLDGNAPLVTASAQGRYELARTHEQLGLLEILNRVGPDRDPAAEGSPAEGIEHTRRALALLEDLVAENPSNGDYRLTMARCYGHLWGASRFLRAAEGPEDLQRIASHAEKAIRLTEQLVEDFPDNPQYRSELAFAYAITSHGLPMPSERGRMQRMIGRLQKGVDMAQRLVETYPDVPQYRASLAACHVALANWLWAAGERDEAARSGRRAVEVARSLAERSPWLRRHPGMLPRALYVAVQIHRLRGEPAEVRPLLEELIAIQREWLDLQSDPPQVPERLPEAYALLAEVLAELGQTQRAAEAAGKARQLRPLVRPGPVRGPLGPLGPLDAGLGAPAGDTEGETASPGP